MLDTFNRFESMATKTAGSICIFVKATDSQKLVITILTSTEKGCSYDVHAAAWDNNSRTATFFATFHGTHVGDREPVPPTNKSTSPRYVYIVTMGDTGKVKPLVKVWNAPWAMTDLGWI